MHSTPTLDAGAVVKVMMNIMFIQGPEKAVSLIWYKIILPTLATYWLQIGIILFVVFVIVIIKAMLGRWGSLGSFLYNFFYFGTLLLIGLIWGPAVFFSNFMNFFTALILYPVCYWLVGWLLEVTELKG